MIFVNTKLLLAARKTMLVRSEYSCVITARQGDGEIITPDPQLLERLGSTAMHSGLVGGHFYSICISY